MILEKGDVLEMDREFKHNYTYTRLVVDPSLAVLDQKSLWDDLIKHIC